MSQTRPLSTILLTSALTAAALLVAPSPADAFCGFYVSGADVQLTNNATMTVMMRDGMRTILSMQNNYEGPPEDFAMVIPVPVVLKEKDVKILPKEVFDKVDKMASPRLVEYWEQDPCYVQPDIYENSFADEESGAMPPSPKSVRGGDLGVKIEAQFEVGEYEVVVLSAKDSSGLDKWLRLNKYNIPKGADAVLEPYVAGGMYFFVAKVNIKKVKFADGRAKLSPLRFHYDTKTFTLPIRLGLLNARGPQDLLVHILARGQRYQVANYKNATIPTNIDVKDEVRKRFGEFYAALYDKTQAKNPGAVITEYAWDASTCDPCPGPNLNGGDFLTLGADVLPGTPQYGFVLTRLHARYTKEQAKEDLVFEAAPPITGGREVYVDKNELEQSSKADSINNFQGRYAIRHVWEGEITCDNPVRGRWGGPPSGTAQPQPSAAQDTAFVKRGAFELTANVMRDIPEIDIDAPISTKELLEGKKPAPTEAPKAGGGEEQSGEEAPPADDEGSKGCSVTSPRSHLPAAVIWVVAALGAIVVYRRR